MNHWSIRAAMLMAVVLFTTGCRSFPRVFKADYGTDYRCGNHDIRRPVLFAQKTDDGLVNLSMCLFTEGLKPDSLIPGGPAWRFSLQCMLWNPNDQAVHEPFSVDVSRPLVSPLMPDTVWLTAIFAAPVTDGSLLLVDMNDLVSGITLSAWASIVEPGFPRPRDREHHLFSEPWLSLPAEAIWPAGGRVSICQGCRPSFPKPPFDESEPAAGLSPDLWTSVHKVDVLNSPQKGGQIHGLLRLSDSTEAFHNYLPLVSSSFPNPTTDEDGFWAVRYITTRAEFIRLVSQGNFLEHLPFLWASNGLEPERAEERATAFRQKIREANQHFTLSGPGSLTDRGMIWIVVGPPDRVWKSHETETWFFGDSDDGIPLRFDFDYTPDADGLPAWTLRRKPSYKSSWDRAVDRWRR